MRLLLIVLSLVLAITPTMAQNLAGHTVMIYDPQHGTQVEYLSQRGRTFLWYPGNDVVLDGRWKRDGDDLCFQYGENTYNPATGQQGGGWECMPFALYAQAIGERAPGDVFGLAERNRVPFRLDRRRTTLEKLLGRVTN
ncbi:hypothetical protein [Devosia sp.]|uniref:hypothetical protein n=1 Tax=Devosia sp. TaxID=1871048 RepID=UPI00292D70B8|nr:hypothetical protein [Devosia sp.]